MFHKIMITPGKHFIFENAAYLAQSTNGINIEHLSVIYVHIVNPANINLSTLSKEAIRAELKKFKGAIIFFA